MLLHARISAARHMFHQTRNGRPRALEQPPNAGLRENKPCLAWNGHRGLHRQAAAHIPPA